MDASGARYVRLDAEYLVHVRPFLTDGEARVYEAAMLTCDGWSRPTTCAVLASITRLHLDSVRRALRSLELLGLIRTHRVGAATSPHAQRTIDIVRDYGPVRAALAAQKRFPDREARVASRSEVGPRAELPGPPSSGSHDPELPQALDRATQSLWPERSRDSGLGDPDPSLSRSSRSNPDPPSLPPLAPPTSMSVNRPDGEEGKNRAKDNRPVPDELVALCRTLWTTTVTR